MHVKGTDGQVSFDGEWLTITRKGFMGVITKGGRGELKLHLNQITGIDLKKPGAMAGRFTVIAPGGVQRSGMFAARSHRDDPLTVLFQHWRLDEFTALRDAVLAAIAAQRQQTTPAVTDLAEQLRQLTALHATGALSDEEFAAAKTRLLG